MNTELLIFSLISLIILIPIIYFLPLNLTKKGKMTIIAVSFLIAIAGLFTKVFMQLWQSVLLLIGLILLLSMILTKKFSPLMFSMADNSTNRMDDYEPEKEKKSLDYAALELVPEIPAHFSNEIAGTKDESLFDEIVEKENDNVHVNEEFMTNELYDIGTILKNEEIDAGGLFSNIDKSVNLTPESNSVLEEAEAIQLDDMDINELADLEQVPEPAANEITLDNHLNYLGELEEMMLEAQAESAVSIESYAGDTSDAETDILPEIETEPMIHDQELEELCLDDGNAEVDVQKLDTQDIESISDFSSEELQSQFDHENEIETAVEEPLIEQISEIMAEVDVYPVGALEENELDSIVNEGTADVIENIEPHLEEQHQVKTIDEIKEENQIIAEEDPQNIMHKEVFDTMLLQVEIAKKMHNRQQYEQIVESFLCYDKSDDKRYKLARTLLKDYINITK